MKRQLRPLAMSLCVLGFMANPALGATDSQVASLQKQVNQLEREVATIKHQKKTRAEDDTLVSTHDVGAQTGVSMNPSLLPVSPEPTNSKHRASPRGVSSLPTTGVTYLPVDLDVPGQSFVSSGPYIGIPLEFSGSNLIINSPSVNQDVALLKIRKNIHNRLSALGVTEEVDHAHVLLSGLVEGQAIYRDIGGGADSSDIDLTSAGLDAYILGPSNWLSSLISLQYDNNIGAQEGSLSTNTRALNSRVYVNQAFVTIGDLLRTPWYGTIGQVYVPFGTYSSNMVSTPLTTYVGRTKERAIVVGYQPQVPKTIYASGFIFKGDSYVGSTSRVNNGGLNLGYRFAQGVFTGDMGGSLIANIADSVGMQAVGNTTANFNGFGGINSTGNEKLTHRVPGLDFRAMSQFGQNITLLGEYVAAIDSFSTADMTMNDHGARPRALNVEAAYTFEAFARPSSVALGYGMTKDALALALPQHRVSAVFNTSVWKDTIQSLEFRHDNNYAASHTASGSGVPAVAESGKADNIITAQFDVYF